MSVMFCDSNSEILYNELEKLGVKGIKMPYTLNSDMYYYDFGEKTNMKDFFDKIKAGVVAKTQALNPDDYVNYFEPVLKAGKDIIYVHFSSAMSGTFNYMKIAIDELLEKYPERKITTCDTLSITMGTGLMVLEAVKMHKEGKSDEEIKEWVEANNQKFTVAFAVDDLFYLKQGGRLKASTALIGSILGIKPICRVSEDGKIETFNKVNGRRKAINFLADYVKEKGRDLENSEIYVLNADCEGDSKILVEEIRARVGGNLTIKEQSIGPVIGAHCGNNVIGVAFLSNER